MAQLLSRLFIFRQQLAMLWRGFWHPATPFYLKAMMVGVVVYLVSPFDIIPDLFLGLGLIDDVLLIAFAVNWMVNRLPREVFEKTHQPRNTGNSHAHMQDPGDSDGPTIDGTSRRM